LSQNFFNIDSKWWCLEGHSFGNLFLSAVFAITNGDMLEAVRVASRVLNSCGQVLPACLGNISLVAELEDGALSMVNRKFLQLTARKATFDRSSGTGCDTGST